MPLTAQRRIDVTPLVGYRFHDSFPTKDAANDQNRGEAKLGYGETFGAAAGFRYFENEVIEFRWTRQNTDLRLTGPTPLGERRQGASVDQYHADFTHEYITQDFPRARPYVIGSAGVTRVKSGAEDFTRFSFGLGGGVKVFPTSRVGFRFEAQWVPWYIEPELKGVFCAGGCIIGVGGKLVHQVQFSVGPIFSF
jgi:hypothetical protein